MNTLAGLSRIEKAEHVRALYEDGFLQQAICDMTGLSRSYVSSLLNDPDGSKDAIRKRRYHGTCVECGAPTYDGGAQPPPERCAPCAARHQREMLLVWDRDTIIAKIREWAEIHGEPPKAMDWNFATEDSPGLQRGPQEQWKTRRWPPLKAVQREFGSWSNALEAAGFERRLPFMLTPEWEKHSYRGGGKKVWTREKIIEAIQAWAAEHGEPPYVRDADHGTFAPSSVTVAREFGSWNAGIKAAGFTPRPPGRPRRRVSDLSPR